MKKIAKLSLVAAVAVAGFTTTASAGALEDAIKNTSILGYATMRYDDRNRDNNTGSNEYTQNNTKIALGLISKITEDLSYTYVGAILGGSDTSDGTSNNGVTNYFGGDIYTVYNNFTYTGFANTSIILGTQGLNVPQTDVYDTISGTQEGTGIAAVTTLGPVTLVGAYMNETNLMGGDQVSKLGLATATANEINKENLIVLQAMSKFAGVALDATYIDVNDTFDSYSVGAKASIDAGVAKLSPYARYTQLEFDGASGDNKLWFVGSKFKAGIVGGNIGYGQTGKKGGFVAVDTDAEAAFQGWATQLNGTKDGSTIKTNLNVDVMSGVNVALNYNTLTFENTNTGLDNDTDEVYGQLTWKPAKNFMAYLRYGQVDYEGSNDGERGRIHVQYTF